MPIQVDWYEEEKRNIRYDMSGEWEWQELHPCFQDVVDLLNSVEYKVNLIIDMTESGRVPTLELSEMRNIANAATMSHPNTSELLAVGINKYMKVMFRVFKRVFPQAASRYKFFSTLKDLNNYLNSSADV